MTARPPPPRSQRLHGGAVGNPPAKACAASIVDAQSTLCVYACNLPTHPTSATVRLRFSLQLPVHCLEVVQIGSAVS